MFEPFKWSVLALAQPAQIQLSLYPDFACKADELALDWEYALEYVKAHQYPFTTEQDRKINALDKILLDISGPENWQYWEDDALRTYPVWEEIRMMAAELAQLFDWPISPPPPPSSDIFISARVERDFNVLRRLRSLFSWSRIARTNPQDGSRKR